MPENVKNLLISMRMCRKNLVEKREGTVKAMPSRDQKLTNWPNLTTPNEPYVRKRVRDVSILQEPPML